MNWSDIFAITFQVGITIFNVAFWYTMGRRDGVSKEKDKRLDTQIDHQLVKMIMAETRKFDVRLTRLEKHYLPMVKLTE